MNLFDAEVFRTTTYRPFENKGRYFRLSTYPYLDVVLNDGCNAHCKFCIGHLVHKKEWTSLEKQEKGIRYAIEKMGCQEVLLLGGEPTINESLFSYVKYLKDNFKLQKTCTTTNGHRIAKDPSYAEKLFGCGITHLNLSYMSEDPEKQKEISGTDVEIRLHQLRKFKKLADDNNVHLRINNNVFIGNNDSLNTMRDFYLAVKDFCHSVKFSPLLKTDSFSTVNEVTEFNRTHILSDDAYDNLWHQMEDEYSYEYPLIRNKQTFGFVEYSMILAPTPIILNYNQHGKLRQRALEGYIHNLKMLPTGDLSLSWNREEKNFFIEI